MYIAAMHYAQCEMEPNAFMPGNLHHRVHGSIEMHQRVGIKKIPQYQSPGVIFIG